MTAAELCGDRPEPRAWRTRLGRCFELSYLTVMDTAESSGWSDSRDRGDPPRVHSSSWLRREDLVYDPVLDWLWASEAYAAKLGAAEAVVYTPREAAALAIAPGTWAPGRVGRPSTRPTQLSARLVSTSACSCDRHGIGEFSRSIARRRRFGAR